MSDSKLPIFFLKNSAKFTIPKDKITSIVDGGSYSKKEEYRVIFFIKLESFFI